MSPSHLILTLALATVSEARDLYERAMYDEALAALGPSCDASEEPRACDEVRAFVYMALGREEDAAAAFDRMLARDPGSGLSAQVAPKIQRLFDERQQAMASLLASEVQPVVGDGDDVPVPVKLEPKGDVALVGATLLLRAEADAEVQRVPMRQEGGAWVAMVVLEEPDEARYALELELSAGAKITLGGDENPQTAFIVTDGAVRSGTDALFPQAGGAEEGDEAAVPTWVWWTAGGVAVVGGVIAVLLLTGGSDENELTVGVTFDGDVP